MTLEDFTKEQLASIIQYYVGKEEAEALGIGYVFDTAED